MGECAYKDGFDNSFDFSIVLLVLLSFICLYFFSRGFFVACVEGFFCELRVLEKGGMMLLVYAEQHGSRGRVGGLCFMEHNCSIVNGLAVCFIRFTK